MKRGLLVVALFLSLASRASAQWQGGGILFKSPNASVSPGDLPALRYQDFTITSAQVLTCFTVPTVLFPAVADTLYLPENFVMHKPAGTAYTIVGVTSAGLRWTTGGTSINLFAPTGFLDQSTKRTLVMRGAGSSTSIYTGLGAGQFNNAIEFGCTGANPAAGTSDIIIRVSYRIWPNDPP